LDWATAVWRDSTIPQQNATWIFLLYGISDHNFVSQYVNYDIFQVDTTEWSKECEELREKKKSVCV